MTEVLFVVGIAIACFVAYNVGGATTGPAFGPAVGAGVIGKATAAILMSAFFFFGAWTLGRRVVETLGEGMVEDPALFTLPVSIVVLFFIGTALLVGNLSGAPSSTSMTAVGAIAGVAIARDVLDVGVVSEILAWWIVSPVIGFWVSVMVGRYLYPSIDRLVAIDRSEGPLVTVERPGAVPRPVRGPNTTRRELVGAALVVGIGCLMAFSSGTSNIANAIAPLVGSGRLGMNVGIFVGSAAVAVGTLTIARRTMETLGNDITDLPLTAAIVVAVVSSTVVVLLSAMGIPASFVIIATMSIAGLGWGRATRTISISDVVRGREPPGPEGTTPTGGDPTMRNGGVAGGTGEDVADVSELFDPTTTARVVVMQNVVPLLATAGAYLTMVFLPGL